MNMFCNHKLGFECLAGNNCGKEFFLVGDHLGFLFVRFPGGSFSLRFFLYFAFPFQHFGLFETFQVSLTTYWYHNIYCNNIYAYVIISIYTD